MEAPTDVAGARRLLGTVNQLGKFIPNLAQITQPIRELLVKSNQWMWEEPQQTAFTKIKEALVTSPVLAHFNVKLWVGSRTTSKSTKRGLPACCIYIKSSDSYRK